MRNLLICLLILAIWSCEPGDFVPDFNQDSVFGLKPVYVDTSDMKISLEGPREIQLAGKIYSYQHFLLVNEVGQGIHIYDNTDPQNPINERFVVIPGNHDMAMKGGILYADNYTNLLALEVTEDTVIVLKTLENVVGFSGDYPSQNDVYFECVDGSKGIVVGWEQAELNQPKCYKP